jgi:hypothetical protein
MDRTQSLKDTEPRWLALRILAGIFKVIAWLLALGGAITSVLAFLSVAGIFHNEIFNWIPSSGGGLIPGIIVLVIGLVSSLVSFIVTYAFGELMLLFVTIELNTRHY